MKPRVNAHRHVKLAVAALVLATGFGGSGIVRHVFAQTPGPIPTGGPFTGNPLQQIGAHISLAGNIPAIANCGTGATIAGSDEAGHIVPGSSPTSSCALTFAVAWNNRPSCVVMGESNTVSYSVTPTGITFSTPLQGQRIHYICFGRAGG